MRKRRESTALRMLSDAKSDCPSMIAAAIFDPYKDWKP